MADSSQSRTIQDLIQGCVQQKPKSQELLYKYFYEFAMRICLRYSANYEEAVEILNDGFMRVFTKIKLYNPELSFYGWLRKVMIHTALNQYKKNKKYAQNYEIQEAKYIATEENSENTLEYRELAADLIQCLSPVYRTVFNLYVIDGYSHEEIAEMLKISMGASKSNLSRARANLRELLKVKYREEYAKYVR